MMYVAAQRVKSTNKVGSLSPVEGLTIVLDFVNPNNFVKDPPDIFQPLLVLRKVTV